MVNPLLFNAWYFEKKEEDGTKVYKIRSNIAKGEVNVNRDGFEFKENGELIKYRVTDKEKPTSHNGRYEIIGDKLYTRFENHYLDTVFRIVSIENNTLKIK
jgi:lipopolysaccharide export LptBFGC system permease protein LptF